MKTRLAIFYLLLVSLSSASAFSQEEKEWSRFTSYVDGNVYISKVTSAEMQTLPSWNPASEDVPLSARKAIEVAKTNLPKFLHAPEWWTLDRLEMTRMTKDKWIYEIYFECLSKECARSDSDWSFMIYVKMDGSIVEPSVEPWDGKVKVY